MSATPCNTMQYHAPIRESSSLEYLYMRIFLLEHFYTKVGGSNECNTMQYHAPNRESSSLEYLYMRIFLLEHFYTKHLDVGLSIKCFFSSHQNIFSTKYMQYYIIMFFLRQYGIKACVCQKFWFSAMRCFVF